LENSSEFGGDFEMIDGDEDDSSLYVDEASNRGGAANHDYRGGAEDQVAEFGSSSKHQSFQVVKRIKTRTANHTLQNQLDETRS
jgi:hypothetical protein